MIKYLIFFLLPLCCSAQTNKVALVDNYLQGERLQGFNGNVLVAQKGKIIYQKAFGYRDYALKSPLNNSSVFELASVSKQFTAMGIMILKEQSKLHLSDTLGMYFPELPYGSITLYQLLTHTSGLPDYQDEMEDKWDHHKIAFNNDVIRFLAVNHPPLRFTPGTRYEYSNTGYVLLASIIMKITGQTYNAFLHEHIFKPLGMDSSRVYNLRRSDRDTIPDYAYGYVFDNSTKTYISPDSLKQYDFVYWLDGVTGDGTVNSTTGDLLKWNNALLHYRLLSKADQADMFAPHVLADTVSKRYYAFGLETGTDELGKFIMHDGAWPGYSTVLSHYDKGDYTIIVLSNNQSYAVEIAKGIAYLLYNKPIVMPYRHIGISVAASIIKKYTGKYAFPIQIEFVERDGKLYRHLPGRYVASDIELKPESPTKFFYTNNSDIQIEFEVDANHKPIRVFLIRCGIRTEGKIEE